jgi:Holliday junction resolvasome RuvABC endonuclease subunit
VTFPNVVGIDPSLSGTAFAHNGNGGGAVVMERPKVTGIWDDRLLSYAEALQAILSDPPELVCIENYLTHAGPGAGASALLVHGALRLTLLQSGFQYAAVTPSTLKKYATGSGAATKGDLRMALFQRHQLDIKDDNKVDAFWLYSIAARLVGKPIEELPKANVSSLEVRYEKKKGFAEKQPVCGVSWPAGRPAHVPFYDAA